MRITVGSVRAVVCEERDSGVVSCPPAHPSLSSQVGFSSGREKANGHIICRRVPPRRLGGCEVIPSLLLPSTSGIYHFIIAVGEEDGEKGQSIHLLSIHLSLR